jgi:hypothetical protein
MRLEELLPELVHNNSEPGGIFPALADAAAAEEACLL